MSRRPVVLAFAGLLLWPLRCALGADTEEETTSSRQPYNVLFISVDDLRPQMRCYGDPIAVTPNMDKLAASGVMFTRAYCQQAVCAPSRASLMTGMRPDTTRVYDLKTHFRKALPEAVTVAQQFRKHGYAAHSVGKIFHGGLDDLPSWDKRLPEKRTSATVSLRDVAETGNGLKAVGRPGSPDAKARSWAISDERDEDLRDGQIATDAIRILQQVKDQPFFLAVGFVKPHLPFIAPKKYFDLYPPERVPMPEQPDAPEGVPEVALTNFGELRSYKDIQSTGPLTQQQTHDLIRAYYASMSYADAQIGRVLDELERLGLSDRTVVVLWGDHGYLLGELGLWNKHTNFELSTRVPLIFRSPEAREKGRSIDGLTELVDVYPTLCDLAGIRKPDGLEGSSLATAILRGEKIRKSAAFSQYPRKDLMGYSIRTADHRYTEWRSPDGRIAASELYDYRNGLVEKVNLADMPEHEKLQKFLGTQLERGWRGALDETAQISNRH